jgi:hypothetical protein
LPLTAVGSNPGRDFTLFYAGKLSRLAYRTLVVLLRCPFMPEKIHGKATEVFLFK